MWNLISVIVITNVDKSLTVEWLHEVDSSLDTGIAEKGESVCLNHQISVR